MTHWTRATKSPPTVEPRGSWITPSERKRGCPGEAEGLATLEGEAAEEFHNNIKTATGSKARWPKLTQPDCTAIFIPCAELIDRIQNYFCD